MIEADHVKRLVDSYLARYPSDGHQRLAPLLEELARSAQAPVERWRPIHITAGAVLLSADLMAVLQIHHRSLEQWLLPGGHVEEEDRSLLSAARRELVEEAGSIGLRASVFSNRPVDIDIHPIPSRSDRDEPSHLHCDFRFVFVANGGSLELAPDELRGFRWVDLQELGALGSRIRGEIDERR